MPRLQPAKESGPLPETADPGAADGPPGAELVAVFDCFSGIAGDMTLAALLQAGASLAAVQSGLGRLALPPFAIAAGPVQRGGIAALHAAVTVEQERTYTPDEMRALVAAAGFPARAAARMLAAIGWLERGEAAAHGTPAPHLHEAGGVDAVVDIAAAMLALEELGVGAAACPVVTVGAGTIVKSAHGVIPAAPGPAATHILQEAGFALRFVEAAHELVTPTGAAILAAVAQPGPLIMTPTSHGYGAGTFDPPGRPNALRVFIGTVQAGRAAAGGPREVVELAANIDDMAPSLLAHARDRLLEEGALDAWIEPIGMKKGRAASKLCALVAAEEEARFASLFLRETTTLGVRANTFRRYEAQRHIETFESEFGPVRMKVGEWEGQRRAVPEFEDVKALAARHGLPALEVQARLVREYHARR